MGKNQKPYGNLQEAQRIILDYASNNSPFTRKDLQKVINQNNNAKEGFHFINLNEIIKPMAGFLGYLSNENKDHYSITHEGLNRLKYLEKRNNELNS